jgi:tetratricopeptide (TPR) repeat protein
MRALAAALLLGLVTARPAAADSPLGGAAVEQARQLAREAARHYQEGRFHQALDGYRRAYDVAPVPELLFNIGQCHFQLKSYEWAIFFYQGYIADRPQAGNRALVESLIAESRRHLRRQRAAASLLFTRVEAAESPPPREEPPAVYQRWWFWTALGVAAVAAGGTAYYLHGSASPALPDRSLGTVDAR